MAFDKEILKEIHSELAALRRDNEDQAEARRENIYTKIPRIREIDTELRTTSLEIVREALFKKEDPAASIEKIRAKNKKLQLERIECLVSHGYAPDYLEVVHRCKKCEDKGYITPGEPCTCLLEEYKKAQVRKLHQVFGFRVKSFDSFNLDYYSTERNGNPVSPRENAQIVFNLCKNYAQNFGDTGENLFFTGGTGLGKTHLASCIALEVATKGFSVVYGTAFEILGAYEDKKFNRDMEEDNTEAYKNAELLIIDDLGAEMITQFSTAALHNIITTRDAAGKSTIIISDLSISQIANKYTRQIASRLEGAYVTVSFIGEDIRKKVGK